MADTSKLVSINYLPAHAKVNDEWVRRHRDALHQCLINSRMAGQQELSIVCALQSWITYAKWHQARYVSPIGDDGMMGEHWKDWGLAVRGLLCGEIGRLDAGTLNSIIVINLTAQGYNVDKGAWEK